ncbi:hypothetical protein A2415_05545 [candidate division WWE3 bacterium RIFOXYC1_FULL_39_7]|uniref:Aminotransferase DegT n=2 Tax=Katanobacteria TaxID=422282 RepID=A0A1F4X8A2_UNCKA|nr:MAG: hypothetical protein A2415_05545 [candidate division WWE3 bacterium RIFOXYC1_FULL_39_7]OGC77878.1 MAG: hypothetical protein A2619_03685 [candidate division WWE3 bacterium RIFOXYD1_FULL_39_9]
MLSRPKIPVFQPSMPAFDDYVQRLKCVWESKMVSNFATNCQEMEQLAINYLGVKHVIGVASGDLGLMAVISSLDIPEGSEAIVPSFTFNSTANVLMWNKLRPVFADIDKKNLCIDPASVAKLITRKTKLIVATHVFGNPCNIAELERMANNYRLKLVFDAAHGYGSEYRGVKVGNFGEAEVFSFSGTKLVTSAEGGLIATNNDELAQRIRYTRNYGFLEDYNSKFLGLNGKISELNAAMGCLTLPEIDIEVAKRNKWAEKYREGLKGIGDIGFQVVNKNNKSTYKDFCIMTSRRDELYNFLDQEGIMTKKYFYPIHKMDYYKKKSFKLSVTELVGDQSLCLPIFGTITKEQIQRVIDSIKVFFER